MCMKNLNSSTILFERIVDSDTLVGVFNNINATRLGNANKISFSMLLCLSAILPKEGGEKDEGVIQRDTEYEIKVRINHVQSGYGIDIDDFVFSTRSPKHLCRDISELKRFIHVRDLSLPYGLGEYGIKVYIKEARDDEKWTLQAINSFMIN